MAAAGPAALEILVALQGVGQLVSDLREGARQFDFMAEAAGRANDAISQLRTAANFTGGTAAGVGALAGAFQSLGLSIETMSQAAEGLRERLFRDPLAIGAFGRSVVPARLGGPQDSAAVLEEAIRMLRETTDAERRLLLARRLGLEALLPLADLDEQRFEALLREGRRRGALVDQDLRTLRATSDAAGERIRLLREERDLMVERVRLRFGNWFRENIRLPIEEFMTRATGAILGGGGAAQPGGDARTQALRENTQALRLLRDEFANAGPRAAGALPGGLRGEALQRALESHSLRLGAFSL